MHCLGFISKVRLILCPDNQSLETSGHMVPRDALSLHVHGMEANGKGYGLTQIGDFCLILIYCKKKNVFRIISQPPFLPGRSMYMGDFSHFLSQFIILKKKDKKDTIDEKLIENR